MPENKLPVFYPNTENQFADAIQQGLAAPYQAQMLVELFLRQIPAEQLAILREELPHPTVDDLLPYVSKYLHSLRTWFDTKVDDLMIVLEQRGREYGEEVLIVMGERGMAEMVKVKVHRNEGSMNQGSPLAERHDTHLDIAGYSILTLAIAEWQADGGITHIGGPEE